MRKLRLDELNRVGLESFRNQQKYPVSVVLDNIRSALNVGSIFRSCDAFAVEALYLCGITARPPHKEINKTAIGATESIKWEYRPDTKSCLEELRKDHTLIGVEQTDESISLDKFRLPEDAARIALVFGNEVDGISEDCLPKLDYAVEVPQFGTKHSINVAVCAGIVIWDFISLFRQA